MNTPQKAAILYLSAVALLVWGFAIGKYQIFPYSIYEDISLYLSDHEEAPDTTVWEKIQNDAGLRPNRLLVDFTPSLDRTYVELAIPDKNPRREHGMLYQTARVSKGYRAISGVFDFEKGLHGAVLLDPSGKIVHRWVMHEQGLGLAKVNPETNKFPHGFLVLPDGSIVFAYDTGSSIQRIDWCGKRLWGTAGNFQHAITADGMGHIWTQRFTTIFSKIDLETGKIVQELDGHAIMRANPEIDIFAIRQMDTDDKSIFILKGGGPWHINDIDPLTPQLAPTFPMFVVGDLMISLRSLNLLYIVDPNTMKVKWWRMGMARRQHDPDWQPDGSISIYDNSMHTPPSRIVKIDPKDYTSKVLFDGRAENFYSAIRGKHQLLPNGNMLITVSQQGRVIEVTPAGELVFEFINTYNSKTNSNLALSEAIYLPEDFFDFKEIPKCPE